MQVLKTLKLNETGLEAFVENLKDASFARDYGAIRIFVSPYFDIDYSHLPTIWQAYISYFCGYYFVHNGKAENIKDAQEKGRNFLTKSIRQFQKEGLAAEALEAQAELGVSYHHSGNIENYEPWLLDALSQCESEYDDVYYSIQVSLLIVYFDKNNKQDGLAIINDIKKKGLPSNLKIKWKFYQNGGRFYRKIGKTTEATLFLEEAIKTAQLLGNKQFEGISINSLTYCKKDKGRVKEALSLIDESINVLKSIKNIGNLAQSKDTKAELLLLDGKPVEALKESGDAVLYARQGDSALELVMFLWTKITILNELQKTREMVETYHDLAIVANDFLELSTQQFYKDQFEALCAIPYKNKNVKHSSEPLAVSNIVQIHKSQKTQSLKYFYVSRSTAQELGYDYELVLIVDENVKPILDDYVLVSASGVFVVAAVEIMRGGQIYLDVYGNIINRCTYVGKIIKIEKK